MTPEVIASFCSLVGAGISFGVLVVRYLTQRDYTRAWREHQDRLAKLPAAERAAFAPPPKPPDSLTRIVTLALLFGAVSSLAICTRLVAFDTPPTAHRAAPTVPAAPVAKSAPVQQRCDADKDCGTGCRCKDRSCRCAAFDKKKATPPPQSQPQGPPQSSLASAAGMPMAGDLCHSWNL